MAALGNMAVILFVVLWGVWGITNDKKDVYLKGGYIYEKWKVIFKSLLGMLKGSLNILFDEYFC